MALKKSGAWDQNDEEASKGRGIASSSSTSTGEGAFGRVDDKDGSSSSGSGTAMAGGNTTNGDSGKGNDDDDELLTKSEVVKRLRAMGMPITLFGETARARQKRMRRLEETHENTHGEDMALKGAHATRNVFLGTGRQLSKDDDDDDDEGANSPRVAKKGTDGPVAASSKAGRDGAGALSSAAAAASTTGAMGAAVRVPNNYPAYAPLCFFALSLFFSHVCFLSFVLYIQLSPALVNADRAVRVIPGERNQPLKKQRKSTCLCPHPNGLRRGGKSWMERMTKQDQPMFIATFGRWSVYGNNIFPTARWLKARLFRAVSN